jgi:DnaJ-domain-containing protein 1
VEVREIDGIVDAYTRKTLDITNKLHRCSCGVFYNAESVEELQRLGNGVCVACKRGNDIVRVMVRPATVLPSSWRELPPHNSSRLARLAALDPYELLEVAPGTPEKALRAAYLAKLKTYHPDHADPFFRDYGGEVTKLLNTAYHKIRKLQGHE